MAWIIRGNTVEWIEVKPEKRVKIGSAYQPPQINYVESDQVWIQDIMTFNKSPWVWNPLKVPEWIFTGFACAAISVVFSLLVRRYL
jgi:hypothetical protein